MSNHIARALAATVVSVGLAGAAYAGTAAAHATPYPAVCDTIDAAPTYESYLIDAYVYGAVRGWDQRQQGVSIAESVMTYCPWHQAGIVSAAEALSN